MQVNYFRMFEFWKVFFAEFFELTVFFQIDMVQKRSCGDVAQLGERGVRNAEVEGSNPFISIPRKSRTWNSISKSLFFCRSHLFNCSVVFFYENVIVKNLGGGIGI